LAAIDMTALQPFVCDRKFRDGVTFAGHRIHQSSSAWEKAKERAGIEDFRFHDLRHTWRRRNSVPWPVALNGNRSQDCLGSCVAET
jgi:integrase